MLLGDHRVVDRGWLAVGSWIFWIVARGRTTHLCGTNEAGYGLVRKLALSIVDILYGLLEGFIVELFYLELSRQR